MRTVLFITILLLSVVLVANAAQPAKSKQVLVIDAGKSATAIVLSKSPTCAAQYAALDLQWHLEKISGVAPEIIREPAKTTAKVRIAVGNTSLGKSLGFPVDKLKAWEFLVAENKGVIVLAGGDDTAVDSVPNLDAVQLVFNGKPNGTLRAAYEFLEEYCGVHWYLPSEAGMVYPYTKKLVVKMAAPVRRSTAYKSNSYYPYQVNKNMYCQPDTPDLPNAPESNLEKWRKQLWNIPISKADMMPVAEVLRWLLRNKVGGVDYGPNHSFSSWLRLYGREHPDWFSYQSKELIEEILAKPGQVAADEYQLGGGPCLSNPGVLAQDIANAKEYFSKGSGQFWSIVPNDNYVWCQCENCKPMYGKPVIDVPLWGGASGSASFYLWDFANKVAREVRKDYPNAWVAGLGYHDYMSPPKNFTLEPNVAVSICTYQGNWTEALRKTAYDVIKAWREQAKCQWIGVWEYFCYSANSNYEPMFPKVCPKLMGQDVKNLHKMGVLAEFIETEDWYGFKDASNEDESRSAVLTNPIWLYINTWTRFKVQDNVSRDVEKMLEEHYKLFYGPAAKPVQQFFELCEARITDAKLRGSKTFNDMSGNKHVADWEYLFPPEQMQKLRNYVDAAVKLATKEPYKTRVRWINEGFLVPQEQASGRYWESKKLNPAGKPGNGVCYRLESAPEIDGASGDQAWKSLPAYYLNNWITGKTPKAQTWFKLGCDNNNLYILTRCDDPDVANVKALSKQHDDPVYTDDCVEIHLTFNPIRSLRHQILINSRGVVQDLKHSSNEAGAVVTDAGWNCAGIVTAAKVDELGWTVEVSIPLPSISANAAAGTVFAMNLAREKYSGGDGIEADEMQSWCVTQGDFADSKNFGRMIVSDTDVYTKWFDQQSSSPEPVLLKADKDNPWIPEQLAIIAIPKQEYTIYKMKAPKVDDEGRVYAGFTVHFNPAIEAGAFDGIELVYAKADLDIMLELIYEYTAADNKTYTNYWLPSHYGEGSPSRQTFFGRFAEAHEKEKPKPVKIDNLTVYAVIEGGKSPKNTEFSLQSIRFTSHSLAAE